MNDSSSLAGLRNPAGMVAAPAGPGNGSAVAAAPAPSGGEPGESPAAGADGTGAGDAARGPAPLARRLLVSPYGIDARGVLSVEGEPVDRLAQVHGCPLFIYSAARMRSALADLRQATHGRVDLYFSIKANPHPAIIQVFHRDGAGAEIASGAEYETARRAGVDPSRILFAGPGKSSAELRHVIERGIGEIHVEAEDELARVADIAGNLGRRVAVSLRINPVAAAQGGSMRMGGQAIQFGIDEERLASVLEAWRHDSRVDLCGLHLFAGTQILDAQVLVTQWSHASALGRRMAAHLGRPLRSLDLGGGLGVPYFSHETALDLGRLRALCAPLFASLAADRWLSKTRIVLEPGRFLVGEAGIYLTRVVSVKESRGKCFAITNGGMHHHLAATGNLGQVIKRDYPLLLANRLPADGDLESGARHPVIVVGPLCTPLDTYGRKTLMPIPAIGDLVAVLQSGAYGLSASPIGFLSQPIAAEVLMDGGRARLIRAAGTFEMPITPPSGY